MKRKTSVFWILFSCSALCFVSLTGIFFRIQQTTPTLAEYSAEPVVIIDAGHGGMDGGAIGIDGQIEKEINIARTKINLLFCISLLRENLFFFNYETSPFSFLYFSRHHQDNLQVKTLQAYQ